VVTEIHKGLGIAKLNLIISCLNHSGCQQLLDIMVLSMLCLSVSDFLVLLLGFLPVTTLGSDLVEQGNFL